jgi:hypothetical protein
MALKKGITDGNANVKLSLSAPKNRYGQKGNPGPVQAGIKVTSEIIVGAC